MSQRGLDYFENNRRAIYAQRAYAIANPHAWKDYGTMFGASPPPTDLADVEREYQGELRAFRGYAARGAEAPMPTTTARWRPLRCFRPSRSRLRS